MHYENIRNENFKVIKISMLLNRTTFFQIVQEFIFAIFNYFFCPRYKNMNKIEFF